MAELKLKAYIPSSDEYEKYFEKFRAFMSADVNEKAEDQGAYISDSYIGKGFFPLRTPWSSNSHELVYGHPSGSLGWSYSDYSDAGLRVAFNLIYNPKSCLVKGSTNEQRTTEVYDEGKVIKVTSIAPIITFGDKKCIWLNKKECEKGTAKTMECWTLDLVAKAVPFSRECNHCDFAKAKELQEQCERVLTEGCTEEELVMLVPVEMSKEDYYQKATPILEKASEWGDE